MDKNNGQIENNGQIMDKNDLKWILNGLNGNHTPVLTKMNCPPQKKIGTHTPSGCFYHLP